MKLDKRLFTYGSTPYPVWPKIRYNPDGTYQIEPWKEGEQFIGQVFNDDGEIVIKKVVPMKPPEKSGQHFFKRYPKPSRLISRTGEQYEWQSGHRNLPKDGYPYEVIFE